MPRKLKAPIKKDEERSVDAVVEENVAKKARESKRNDKLTEELMYGKKAHKRTIRDTTSERDRHWARLHSFGGQGDIVMAWDLNEQSIRDQIFMIKVGNQTTYLSAVEIQKYLRWI